MRGGCVVRAWRRTAKEGGREISSAEHMAGMIHLERLPHELQAIKLHRAASATEQKNTKFGAQNLNQGSKIIAAAAATASTITP